MHVDDHSSSMICYWHFLYERQQEIAQMRFVRLPRCLCCRCDILPSHFTDDLKIKIVHILRKADHVFSTSISFYLHEACVIVCQSFLDGKQSFGNVSTWKPTCLAATKKGITSVEESPLSACYMILYISMLLCLLQSTSTSNC